MKIEDILHNFKNRTPTIMGSERLAKYAVLLPLLKENGDYHILFEVRSLQLRRQPGEVCFPGGRIDKTDVDSKHTALRETSEELGIDENNISNVAPLDYMISPFGTIVYPYVGVIEQPRLMNLNPMEVGEVFTVPLSFLLKNKPEIHQVYYKPEPAQDFPYDALVGGKNYNWQPRAMEEYFYYYEGKVIWGLTARILGHFLEVMNS